MKKNGFTLVELIGVIFILSLVIAIAYTGISTLIDRVNKKQSENIIKNIEEVASSYAFDTGKTLIFVEELVNNGYYEADDNGDVINPDNNEKMNCYIVEMVKQGTYYTANFKNIKYEKSDGTCDSSKISIKSNNINVDAYINGTKISNTNNWIKGNNIVLKANSSSMSIECTKNECIWNSTSGVKQTGNKEISINNISLLKVNYTFQYNVINNSSVNRYNATIELKIDNENPIIHLDDTIIYNRNDNIPKKDVEISASDGNGSGIGGYYIGTNSNCNSATYTSNKKINVSSNNTYTICVKDKVGNISKGSIRIP